MIFYNIILRYEKCIVVEIVAEPKIDVLNTQLKLLSNTFLCRHLFVQNNYIWYIRWGLLELL